MAATADQRQAIKRSQNARPDRLAAPPGRDHTAVPIDTTRPAQPRADRAVFLHAHPPGRTPHRLLNGHRYQPKPTARKGTTSTSQGHPGP